MLKKYSYILLFFVMSFSVFGSICEDNIQPLTNCTVITPTINCQIYDYVVYSANGSIYQNGTLSNIVNEVYSFNFTAPNGEYFAVLCDGSTRTFYVNYYNLNVFGESFNWLAIISIFIVISVVCLWISKKIKNDDLYLFKTLLFFYGMINTFIMIFLTLFISSGYSINNFSGFFNIYTIIVIILLAIFILYYCFYLVIQAFKTTDKVDKK